MPPGVNMSGGTGIQMAAHWDINSPCAGTHLEAGKNLSVREALNLEKAKSEKRKAKKVKVGSGGLKIKFVFI